MNTFRIPPNILKQQISAHILGWLIQNPGVQVLVNSVSIEMDDVIKMPLCHSSTQGTFQLLKRWRAQHVQLEKGTGVFAEPLYKTACNRAERHIVDCVWTADHE